MLHSFRTPALRLNCSLWGCKVKILAAFALVLCSFLPVRADEISTPDGLLVLPNGSQVTSIFVLPPGTFDPGASTYGVDFSFADGIGSTLGNFNDGNQGIINFTTPVTSLTVNWLSQGSSFIWDGGPVCENLDPPSFCPSTGTFTLTGSISSLTWVYFNGFGGPVSISYVLAPVTAAEPAAFGLLLTGLLLLGLSKWAQISLRKLSRR